MAPKKKKLETNISVNRYDVGGGVTAADCELIARVALRSAYAIRTQEYGEVRGSNKMKTHGDVICIGIDHSDIEFDDKHGLPVLAQIFLNEPSLEELLRKQWTKLCDNVNDAAAGGVLYEQDFDRWIKPMLYMLEAPAE